MGFFDSLRDSMRPDDSSEPEEEASESDGPKHLAEGTPPDLVTDPNETEQPTGGKHARRD